MTQLFIQQSSTWHMQSHLGGSSLKAHGTMKGVAQLNANHSIEPIYILGWPN